MDRIGEVEGGAAVEPMRSGKNQARGHEISLDLEPFRGGGRSGGGARRDLPSPAVELNAISLHQRWSSTRSPFAGGGTEKKMREKEREREREIEVGRSEGDEMIPERVSRRYR